MDRKKVIAILDGLEEMYPEAKCALDHQDVFQLIVAVALSAQTTDKSVNQVTPALFEAYPDAEALAAAEPEDVEPYIRRIGLYKNKAKNIVAMARKSCEEFDGSVPQDRKKLESLPGVGRKTANVVLADGFGEQHIAVDTHVFRVSNRIGIVHEKDVLKTELGLMDQIPEDRWTRTHHCIIFHGRRCCTARKPDCEHCGIAELCEKNL